MWQFVHQNDLVDAIVGLVKSDEIGVFNIAGQSAIPLIEAFRLTDRPLLALPAQLARGYLSLQRRFGRGFPPYLLEFFKYPVVIGDDKLRKAIGYEPKVGIVESIRSCVRG